MAVNRKKHRLIDLAQSFISAELAEKAGLIETPRIEIPERGNQKYLVMVDNNDRFVDCVRVTGEISEGYVVDTADEKEVRLVKGFYEIRPRPFLDEFDEYGSKPIDMSESEEEEGNLPGYSLERIISKLRG